MNSIYLQHTAEALGVAQWQVEHCVELLEQGATIPFISRYRKERTGGLNEVQVGEVKHYFLFFEQLARRKEAIVKSIEDQGAMTDALRASIDNETDAARLEDIYLPYRPKRKTRASEARARGLEPLADDLFAGKLQDAARVAERYVDDSKGVADVAQALAGARDIIAEKVSENAAVRSSLRNLYASSGTVVCKVAKGAADKADADKYENWSDFSQRLSKIPAHRLLAILRGDDQGILSVKVDVPENAVIDRIEASIKLRARRLSSSAATQVNEAIADSYKRLLHPSIEKECLKIAKQKADIESIKLFGENLRQLLLAPPVGQKRTMAIDPGFRTGCKVVCLDAQGNLLANDAIFPHPPVNEKMVAMRKICSMVEDYGIEVIAIGNGTAGRETEAFIKRLALPEEIKIYMVSEDGASVYSASETAREEFPQHDVTVRGAVSIGRRLMDPLAELVKIDPKSIGVGQYQHDVDQALLKESLDNTVESCVNSVGVNLNTASKHLLSYVSGIGNSLASNIVAYRAEHGPFASREELKKVSRLGDKAFEQCAGFLRIPGGSNPLDNSAVHPESYHIVRRMAADAGVSVEQLISDEKLCSSIDLSKYVTDEVGMPTLKDIAAELAKPGRDPRSVARTFEFSSQISTIEDVQPGMELPGIVTNITAFGAFVDIGIKQNGLIHISRMSKRRIESPSEVLKIHQQVMTRVVEVDLKRSRIALALIFE